jgi:pilus assembly protein CpaE
MSNQEQNTPEKRTRVHLSGSCEGLEKVREGLTGHDAIELVGYEPDVRDAVGPLAGGHLDVVLHATRASALPLDEVAHIREYTRAPIVLITPGASTTVVEEAIESDEIDNVLPLPMVTEQVVFAIRKAAVAGRRQFADGKRRGKVLTVFSPKGGTGKSATATNLAWSLAKLEGRRTLLLDLDLQFGDAAIMVGLEPEKTIYDLVVAPGELDTEKLTGYITKHTSGLDVLPAPLRPEDAELITETKIGPLLEVSRQAYDAIVVDTSPFFHGPMLATLDQTDALLLVCTGDVPTVKNVRLSLQTLDLLSFPAERVSILLNRPNPNVGLKRKEIEAALDFPIRFEMPHEPNVPNGVNKGTPAVAESGSDYAKAIRELGRGVFITNTATSRNGRRRWLPTLTKS